MELRRTLIAISNDARGWLKAWSRDFTEHEAAQSGPGDGRPNPLAWQLGHLGRAPRELSRRRGRRAPEGAGQAANRLGEVEMQRVTGIGGIFFKARDAERLREWYREHLGLPVADWGGVSFDGREARPGERQTSTVWSVFSGDTRYFEPSTSSFMINYRVDDLDGLLAALRAEGCEVDPRIEESEFGRFGWVMDPEGSRIELWEPPRV